MENAISMLIDTTSRLKKEATREIRRAQNEIDLFEKEKEELKLKLRHMEGLIQLKKELNILLKEI